MRHLDEIREQLIDDLILFGRCVYKELTDGTIERLNPFTEIPEEDETR
jgi:hypothetical protein